jgi:cytoplasmic iron level regulating protein YaaA (DUF328/UPF0246 family)
MLVILGPAKNMDVSPHGVTRQQSYPDYLNEAEVLVNLLRDYSVPQLENLMKISGKLATLTFERYAAWRTDYPPDEACQALLSFSGEVFNGLKARTLSEEDLLFAQDRVRILSGLYGVLRPLDLILPYRLEMGTGLSNPNGKNLYEYWSGIIPARIREDTVSQSPPVLINLASKEYFSSIDPGSFPHEVITPVFKETHGDGFRNVTVYAKKARGMMLRFILQNRITDPEYLKGFDEEGYGYLPQSSTETEWVFSR